MRNGDRIKLDISVSGSTTKVKGNQAFTPGTRTSPRSWNKRGLDKTAVSSSKRQKVDQVEKSLQKEIIERKGDSCMMHVKCRQQHYTTKDGGVDRFVVPDGFASWDKPFPAYKPISYTDTYILDKKPVWADPDVSNQESFKKIKFNNLDGPVNRESFVKKYDIIEGVPRNPIGRTGISGRGLLGKWGPNHAADPIVTRWKRDDKGQIMKQKDGRQILEFVSIQRTDTKEWAIPGGMVDGDEEVSLTLKREFGEEALNALEADQKEQTKEDIDYLFNHGEVIYKGYVDDPRNTDNSWMETVACNFHDEDGTTVGRIPLTAGDDAQAVQWLSIDGPLKLYASHGDFVKKVCDKRKAYFS